MHRELADLGLVDFDYVYGDAVMGPNHEDAACMDTPRGQRRAKERERRGEEKNITWAEEPGAREDPVLV